MKPLNLNPLIAVALQTAPAVNAALSDGNITVDEAIDIAAAAAKASARQMGISDKPVATTKPAESGDEA